MRSRADPHLGRPLDVRSNLGRDFRVLDSARMIHMPDLTGDGVLSPDAARGGMFRAARRGERRTSRIPITERGADHPSELPPRRRPSTLHEDRTWQRGGAACRDRCPVAFEVDYHADDFQIAWSVLMNGTISRLDAAATAAYEELRRPPVPWAGSASSLPVRFVPRTVSGRGLHRTRPD